MLQYLDIIFDIIKYCDHPRCYERIQQPRGGTSDRKFHLAVDRRSSGATHVGPHMGAHVACSYEKEVEQTWGIRWICIHVLMHVHILPKVWDQERGEWDTRKGPYMFIHSYAKWWNRCGESGGYAYMY